MNINIKTTPFSIAFESPVFWFKQCQFKLVSLQYEAIAVAFQSTSACKPSLLIYDDFQTTLSRVTIIYLIH